jgi:hypothetical protein
MEDVYVSFLVVLALYLLIPMFIGKFRCEDGFYEKQTLRPTLQHDYVSNPTRDFAPLT